MQAKTITQEGQSSIVEDYSGILKDLGLGFTPSPPYYQVGIPGKAQGWVLHLSSLWTQIPQLLEAVVPILKKYSVSFKVVPNRKVAAALCDGEFGYHQQGKVMCIYPPTDDMAAALAQELLEVTKDFSGCNIPTDFCLGGILYTRYGSFGLDVRMDQDGNIVRYIQNASGQPVLDEYHTPFKFPKGVPWPFGSLAEPVEQAPSTFLKDSYKIYSTLKADAKGRVMRSLRMQGLKVSWIVIKEAKHGVFVDLKGRDIRDRLNWQYELLSDLEHKIRVPKVYDYFTENGNAYLVMEYIKGKPLEDVLANTYRSTTWRDLDAAKKQELIADFLKLLWIVDTMHECGYIHRDINTVNFLKDRKGQLVVIDPELTFSTKKHKPFPPFTVGTPGFISPEQERTELPTTNQDVYSLGATMVKFFTNLSPGMFARNSPDLVDDLNFFIQDERISKLISSCLSHEPENRPAIQTILSQVEDVKRETGMHDHPLKDERDQLKPAIEGLIRAFATYDFVDTQGIWFSKAVKDESLTNHQTERTYSSGLYKGVSGPLYTLAKAKMAGYDLEKVQPVYMRNWKYIHDQFLPALPNVLPGLYHGSAGIAMAIAKGIEAGLINEENQSSIQKCLELANPLVDLSTGIAGQGIAILKCSGLIEKEASSRLLQAHVGTLLQQQRKDGSWVSHIREGGKPACFTGLAHGSAGICLFLLDYYEKYRDPGVEQAVQQALKWLQHQARKVRTGIFWRVNNRTKKVSLGLNEGSVGIALCFIKAYEAFGNESYRQTAEKALAHYTKHFVTENLTMSGGVTGLGLVYLEAQRVLGGDEWEKRADFIFSSLVHSAYKAKETRYWIVDGSIMQTADLMTGNSGILHFLLTYSSPEKDSFL